MATPEKDGTQKKIYWAKASRCQLSGLKAEKKDSVGHVSQVDVPLEFHDHIYATDDPKAIKLIESSATFIRGDIKKCDSVEQAQTYAAAHAAHRAGVVHHPVTVESIENRDAQFERDRRKE
jgi:hypothetical protein